MSLQLVQNWGCQGMLRVVVLHRLGRDRLGTIDLESPMQFKVYKQWLCIIHGWASELCPLLGPWCPSLPLLTKSNSTRNAQYPLGYIHTLQICCSHFCARLIHLNVVCAEPCTRCRNNPIKDPPLHKSSVCEYRPTLHACSYSQSWDSPILVTIISPILWKVVKPGPGTSHIE